MTSITHALVGCMIAQRIPDPILSTLLIISSHFIMDSIPHWDFGTDWRARPKHMTGILAIVDTLSAYTLAYIFFSPSLSPVSIISATTLSLLPDWLLTPWYIFYAKPDASKHTTSWSFIKHVAYGIHRFENIFHTKASFTLGVATQIGVLAFFYSLLNASR